jgi:hypothetical protein
LFPSCCIGKTCIITEELLLRKETNFLPSFATRTPHPCQTAVPVPHTFIMGDDTTEARRQAMVEFLGTFPTLSGAPPADFADLSDGVALFEVLSEM